MISRFVIDSVIEDILVSEGGYVNDKDDHGGATNFGITQATLEAYSGVKQTPTSMKALTRTDAAKIYEAKYVKPFIELFNPIIFKFLVNAAVNHGVAGATKMLQRVVGTTPDGILGINTFRAVAVADGFPDRFLADLVAERLRYYTNIVAKDRSQIKFLAGWMNRVARDLT